MVAVRRVMSTQGKAAHTWRRYQSWRIRFPEPEPLWMLWARWPSVVGAGPGSVCWRVHSSLYPLGASSNPQL